MCERRQFYIAKTSEDVPIANTHRARPISSLAQLVVVPGAQNCS